MTKLEFRRWLRDAYLPNKFPKYLKKKVTDGVIGPIAAELLLEAFDDD